VTKFRAVERGGSARKGRERGVLRTSPYFTAIAIGSSSVKTVRRLIKRKRKTLDWKTRDQMTGMENAKTLSMERQMYKKKTSCTRRLLERGIQLIGLNVKNSLDVPLCLALNSPQL